jgi:hypothetical protein
LIVNVAGDTTKFGKSLVAVCGVAELSVTCTVKLLLPAVVGVPATSPLVVSRVKPGGKLPALMAYVNGDVPPLGVQLPENASPTLAAPKLHVKVKAPAEIGKLLKSWVAVCGVADVSVTWTVKLLLPAAVGVPETVPEAPSKLSPGGKDPALIENV